MKKNNKKGFTLVELVIVVAVMAILVAVAIPTVKSITESAQKSVDDTNARTIESIIKLQEAQDSVNATEAATDLKTAIDDAKLGIKSKTFYYDFETGTVEVAGTTAPTQTAGDMTLAFGTDTKVTVTVKS